jgi:hypothetical protein
MNRNMSKYKLAIAVLIAFALSAFNTRLNSMVKGSVNPPDAAIRAWLISKADTVNGNVDRGMFEITNVRPGSYSLIVEGRPPYRNSLKEGVNVIDGQLTDVGVIEMQK